MQVETLLLHKFLGKGYNIILDISTKHVSPPQILAGKNVKQNLSIYRQIKFVQGVKKKRILYLMIKSQKLEIK